MVEVKDLYKSYGNIEVLRGIDLKIEKCEIVAILGPSGSGKSTLLHIIGGIERPTRGNVFFNKIDIFSLDKDDLNRFRAKNIGFILQFYNLISNLSILENVLLPSLIIGNNGKQRALKLLESLSLSLRINHLPNRISFGEQQRVAIARALINYPEIIIADEPTGSLDSKMAEEVFSLLKFFVVKENKGCIMATHNENLGKIADKVFRLSDGKLI